ncbi:hypothetical protein [Pseudomonas syringae]|uniref:hypothetical protein n=1 Tax=Pseudomonas syringae TaxID=317 RepID=UPI0013C325BF|nr:hypothetical protein [Pseudomonas syringae]
MQTLPGFRQACPKEEQRLPELVNVTLATNGPQRFVLSGIEYVDGCAYAQACVIENIEACCDAEYFGSQGKITLLNEYTSLLKGVILF